MANPLPAFNGTTAINTAGAWSKQQILTFFGQVRDNPATYNVITSAIPSLTPVVQAINTLVPSGTGAGTVILANPLQLDYQGHNFTVETLFDLVGWIFSVAGTSPNNATRSNYYYPLTGLYCYFCRKLIENPRQEPQMTQLTFFTQGNNVRACLSANLDKPTKARKDAARGRRFAQLVAGGLNTEQERNTSFVLLPNGSYAQLFGHCAETFPFLFLNAIRAQANVPGAHGFAVRPQLALPAVGNNYVYVETDLVASLADPCANCKILIQKAGLTLTNFTV